MKKSCKLMQFVVILAIVALAITTGLAKRETQNFLPKHYNSFAFDRLLVTDIEKTDDKAIITVTYTLSTSHRVPVYVGASMMNDNNETIGFGFKPVAIRRGSGKAKVEISTAGNQTLSKNNVTVYLGFGNAKLEISTGGNHHLSTNKVSVFLYEGGKYPFAQLTQDLALDWHFGSTPPGNQGQNNSWGGNPTAPSQGQYATWLHAPDGDFTKAHQDVIMNYITWGGAQWTVKLEGNTFIHAPNGDFSKAHKDTIMNYTSWDGTNWTAKMDGNIFVHAPKGDFSRAHRDSIINYLTWGGAHWTAKIAPPNQR